MLDEYRKKRDFHKTKEPKQNQMTHNVRPAFTGRKGKKLIFVIQKHNATRLHFDFRLENKGVLVSWAVPKGLSEDPKDKRLAVMTEDHPMGYANFHGRIPEGEYGAGTVEVWDKGNYVNITVKGDKVRPFEECIEKGELKIYIKGRKIVGAYALIRMKDKNWLIIREKEDKEQRKSGEIVVGKQAVQLTNLDKEIDKGIVKGDLIKYYMKIAPLMLQHVKDRPVSMFRFPDGVKGEKFFQKNTPDYFPKWIPCKDVHHNGKSVCYTVVKNEASIIYLANYMTVPHITVDRVDKLGRPDKIVFDLDPSNDMPAELKEAAKSLGSFLKKIGFTPYIMTTGGKGYHVVAPIRRELDNSGVRSFALKIAAVMAGNDPKLTTDIRKEKRVGKIFIDVNRISSMQTSVAPYAARSSPGLPIAAPFHWDELPNADPQYFTIKNPPKEDAWKSFFRKPASIAQIIKKLK